ncbi:MAG: efflux RND transporter periplasmic adaptor subunit [Verrucomicrobia bacterium]|nr:MAG: efflux RND transporter periplasmic adaptor subunit [Verrucomicrobiota bacterium]
MPAKPANLDALRIDRSQTPPASRSGAWRWLVAVLLLGLVAGAWWYSRAGAIAVQTALVQVPSAASDPGGRTLLNASGYVTTRLKATVSSKITGKVAEIRVEEGMQVAKDQILATLDASNVQSGLRLAQAQLAAAALALEESAPLAKFAAAEFQRLTTLESPRSVSLSDLGKAEAEAHMQQAKRERQRAEVTVAQRQVEQWQQQLDDTIIRAPFAGVVTTKDSQPGEMISPMSAGGFTRTGICTLVDMASLEIEVDVGESYINRVQAGQAVEATLDAYPEWKIPCQVTAIIPTADRQKATVKVRVGFAKLDARILPQMGVKVAFQGSAPAAPTATHNAVAVPKEALQSVNGRDIAWVVSNGKAQRRAVTVAGANASQVTLSAGLAQGETVVLNPPATLSDGSAVTIQTTR